LTAGLVPLFYGRYLTGSVASSVRDWTRGGSCPLLSARPQ